MARIRIEMPEQFPFSTQFSVRITDINYGGHGGNDVILGMIHEGRKQYLSSLGYTEMEFEGVGMIMSDVAIEFKNELFYGDIIEISVAAGNFSRVGFDLYYKIEKLEGDKKIIVANTKTGMVCYDYDKKKIATLPEAAMNRMKV